MKTTTFALLVMFWAAVNGLAQSAPKDPDAIQALLVEVHQLRQDIEAMTVASQRVQIALHGLQMQDAAVARSGQRLDEARSKRMQAEAAREHIAAEVQMTETRNAIRTGMETPSELKARELGLTNMKQELERINAEVQSRQAAEAEASTQFRTEQAKLTDVQDRIERLDKVLEKLGAPPAK